MDILSLAGLRIDGRRSNELRSISHKIGVVNGADGSAYLEQGLNKVLVAVMGPHQPNRRSTDVNVNEKCNLICRVSDAPFSGWQRKERKQGDRKLQDMERIILDIIEAVILVDLYPKSEITISVHILETDGSVLCVAMNAICLALMSAGISMSDMVVACSVGYASNNTVTSTTVNTTSTKKEFCLDLNQIEIGGGGAHMPIVVKARSEEILYIQLESRLSYEALPDGLELAIEGCRFIRNYMEIAMKKYMKEQLEKLN